MNWQNALKLIKSDYVKLVPILALAFYIAFIPNLNYPYAVHIDEWVHIAHQNALLRAGEIFYPDPFSGQPFSGKVISGEDLIATLELGYHVPLAVFRQLSGISWMDIARYFPGFVFMFTVLSVYIFAKRLGFGWEAAFFTTLIPTTVGIMGPAFMIPVAMALMFVPLLLFLVFNFRTRWSYLILSIGIAFTVILHAGASIIIATILVPFIIFGSIDNFKHSLFMVLALAFPFLVTLPWTLNLIVSEATNLFITKPLSPVHDYIRVITEYGYIPVLFCLFGIFILTIRGGYKNYSLVASLLTISILLAVFYTLGYGIHMLYLRGILFAMLMMSIIAGAGLRAIREPAFPWIDKLKQKKPRIVQAMSVLLCLIVVGGTLTSTIPARQSIPYYHMIDKIDYEAFVWIKDNIDSSYQKAILDPWKATPFAALTERYVYTRIHSAPKATDEEAYNFLRSGSANTTFLTENEISIIYTRTYEWEQGANIEYGVNNPDLVQVRKNIYRLKENGTQ